MKTLLESFRPNLRTLKKAVLIPFLLIGGCQLATLCALTGDLSPLLPVTMPTKVRLIDGTSQKPIVGIPVIFWWGWSQGNAGAYQGGKTTHQETLTTDANGEVRLPIRLKPFQFVLFPLFGQTFDGISFVPGDARYWLRQKSPSYGGGWSYGPSWKITGGEWSYELKLPEEDLKDWGRNLPRIASHFGQSVWERNVDSLLSSAGDFNRLPGETLVGMESSCFYNVNERCEALDKEILRRDPLGETPPGKRARSRQSAWGAVIQGLSIGALIEAGLTAQDAHKWELSGMFANQAIYRDRKSFKAWEIKSVAVNNMAAREIGTLQSDMKDAARVTAIRAVKHGGAASAWLALAEACKQPDYNKGAREAVWAAAQLAPNDPKVIKMLSEAGPMPPWFRLRKVESPD